jgi:hypothetical protein
MSGRIKVLTSAGVPRQEADLPPLGYPLEVQVKFNIVYANATNCKNNKIIY